MNVEQFAKELKLSPDLLLEKLKAAGVNKSAAEDAITETDKTQLLDYLRKMHGAEDQPKTKITLTRKPTSEIKKADSTGKSRTIQVEVRKKRTYVKKDAAAAEAPPPTQEAAPEPVIEEIPAITTEQPVVEIEAAAPKSVVVEEAAPPVEEAKPKTQHEEESGYRHR